jgi:hypothetical protein
MREAIEMLNPKLKANDHGRVAVSLKEVTKGARQTRKGWLRKGRWRTKTKKKKRRKKKKNQKRRKG